MAQGTTSASSSAKSDYEAVEKDISQLKNDVRKLTETLEQIVKARVDSGRESASSTYDTAKRRAEELRDGATARVDESLLQARATVASRPLTSLSAALGVGVALGLLLRRH